MGHAWRAQASAGRPHQSRLLRSGSFLLLQRHFCRPSMLRQLCKAIARPRWSLARSGAVPGWNKDREVSAGKEVGVCPLCLPFPPALPASLRLGALAFTRTLLLGREASLLAARLVLASIMVWMECGCRRDAAEDEPAVDGGGWVIRWLVLRCLCRFGPPS